MQAEQVLQEVVANVMAERSFRCQNRECREVHLRRQLAPDGRPATGEAELRAQAVGAGFTASAPAAAIRSNVRLGIRATRVGGRGTAADRQRRILLHWRLDGRVSAVGLRSDGHRCCAAAVGSWKPPLRLATSRTLSTSMPAAHQHSEPFRMKSRQNGTVPGQLSFWSSPVRMSHTLRPERCQQQGTTSGECTIHGSALP